MSTEHQNAGGRVSILAFGQTEFQVRFLTRPTDLHELAQLHRQAMGQESKYSLPEH